MQLINSAGELTRSFEKSRPNAVTNNNSGIKQKYLFLIRKYWIKIFELL